MEYKNKRRIITGISIFLLLVFYLFRNLSESLRVFGFIFGIYVFYFIDHSFNLEYELKHYFYIIIILSLGVLTSPLYTISPYYDKFLHFFLPILACLLVFHIVDKQKIIMQWKLLITFMFVIAFLSIHEMGEYLLDLLWDMKHQGVYLRDFTGFEKLNLVMSKIDDTMWDMILGTISSLLFVITKTISYLYQKKFIIKGKK